MNAVPVDSALTLKILQKTIAATAMTRYSK